MEVNMRYLAFDLGAESGRAIVGTVKNGRLLLEEVYRFQNRPLLVQGHLHWDVYRLFEELKFGLQAATARYKDIVSLAIDTWGVDFGLLTEDGILIGLPMMYRDPITEGIPEEIYGLISREELYRITGLQTMRFDTLFQLYALEKRSPGYLKAAHSLLFMPNLLGYLFTGQGAADLSIASTSHFYNPSFHRWATSLLERLGLPADILPSLVYPGTIIGPLLKEIAEECNASGMELICVGSHDTASAVASVPAQGERWAYISSGTWSLMGAELEKPLINDEGMQYDFTNEVGYGGSIRYLKNIVGLWLLQGIRRSLESRGIPMSYPEMVAAAEKTAPLQVLIDVDEPDFMNVGDMMDKVDAFCRKTGQPLPEGAGGYARCVLESLALRYREVMALLKKLTGADYDTLHIVGGGSKNIMLNSFTASACHMQVLAGPDEATAAGNILVQAITRDEIASLANAREVVGNSFDLIEYLPQNPEIWDRAYEKYRTLKERI